MKCPVDDDIVFLLKMLLNENIDPITGDCFCFAAALQKITDPEMYFTEILCVTIEPNGVIGHCMLKDKRNNEYYDIYGIHNYSDAIAVLKEMIDEECFPNERNEFPESCLQITNYRDVKIINQICRHDKINVIEGFIRRFPPSWIISLLYDGKMDVCIIVDEEGTYDEIHTFDIIIKDFVVGRAVFRDDCYLEEIKILPSLRNLGIGKKALQLLELEMKRIGCDRIYLLAVDNSVRFFKNEGFHITGMEGSYYKMEKN